MSPVSHPLHIAVDGSAVGGSAVGGSAVGGSAVGGSAFGGWAAGGSPTASGIDGLDSQVFQRLLDDRIVFVGSAIDDAVANRVCAQLLLLAAADRRRDISLYVNSPGGSVDAGMAIYDTMQYVENDVATYALGLAASMGQFLLCAGTAGKRFALPHARIMMHQPHGGLGGTASDIAIQAEQALYMKRTIAERIAAHTGRPLAEIEADADRDRWFTAEEAKDYGLIDLVVSRASRHPSGFAAR